jgi:hypothetical protein
MPLQRRARDRDGSIIQPMTLANMRENGVRIGRVTLRLRAADLDMREQVVSGAPLVETRGPWRTIRCPYPSLTGPGVTWGHWGVTGYSGDIVGAAGIFHAAHDRLLT